MEIESAKWNMYAEQFGTAERELDQAKNYAIAIRDKAKIDEILNLIAKCERREKVEI